jgi:hypothetical protein
MTPSDTAATDAPSGLPDTPPLDRTDSGFTRCTSCNMQVRRSELEIHLAHAHNIGPRPEKKPSKRDGGSRRS